MSVLGESAKNEKRSGEHGAAKEVVIVVGMGEVGGPLARILSQSFRCVEVDALPVSIAESCSILHICYPYKGTEFVPTTIQYIQKYRPLLTIINSTVAPGTSRTVWEASGGQLLAYSPVRGKHARMEQDLIRYRKFVAGCNLRSTELALTHFKEAGLKTGSFRTPEVAELSKLLETTYLGVLVGWAQEMERCASRFSATFDEVNEFIREIDFLPSHVFPGHIGGHCVIPNIDILRQHFSSSFFEAVIESNDLKANSSFSVERNAND
jgi:UDP-glucose/GDP-mannose dehydrogenase family protein